MVYLPTVYHKNQPNIAKYTIHGSYGHLFSGAFAVKLPGVYTTWAHQLVMSTKLHGVISATEREGDNWAAHSACV